MGGITVTTDNWRYLNEHGMNRSNVQATAHLANCLALLQLHQLQEQALRCLDDRGDIFQ